MKINFNRILNKNLYYWRDSNGNELDTIMESAGYFTALEIKSTKTFKKELLKGLNYWKALRSKEAKNNFLVYAGEESYKYDGIKIINWNNLNTIFQ